MKIYFLLILILNLFPIFYAQVRTTKGHELIEHDGFEYRKKTGDNAIISQGTIQVWMCPIKTCNGRIHTAVDSDVVMRVVTGHNHQRKITKHIVNLYKLYYILKINSLI